MSIGAQDEPSGDLREWEYLTANFDHDNLFNDPVEHSIEPLSHHGTNMRCPVSHTTILQNRAFNSQESIATGSHTQAPTSAGTATGIENGGNAGNLGQLTFPTMSASIPAQHRPSLDQFIPAWANAAIPSIHANLPEVHTHHSDPSLPIGWARTSDKKISVAHQPSTTICNSLPWAHTSNQPLSSNLPSFNYALEVQSDPHSTLNTSVANNWERRTQQQFLMQSIDEMEQNHNLLFAQTFPNFPIRNDSATEFQTPAGLLPYYMDSNTTSRTSYMAGHGASLELQNIAFRPEEANNRIQTLKSLTQRVSTDLLGPLERTEKHTPNDLSFPLPPHPLLKPLSAYNYFYRVERDNIVDRSTEPGSILPKPMLVFDQNQLESLLYQHWYNDPMKKKRAHRRSHGILGFTE